MAKCLCPSDNPCTYWVFKPFPGFGFSPSISCTECQNPGRVRHRLLAIGPRVERMNDRTTLVFISVGLGIAPDFRPTPSLFVQLLVFGSLAVDKPMLHNSSVKTYMHKRTFTQPMPRVMCLHKHCCMFILKIFLKIPSTHVIAKL